VVVVFLCAKYQMHGLKRFRQNLDGGRVQTTANMGAIKNRAIEKAKYGAYP